MAIGSLQDKVQSSDLDTARNQLNPPDYAPGFEPSGGDDWDQLDDLFGGSEGQGMDDIFGSNTGSSGSNYTMDDIFGDGGGDDIFGGQSNNRDPFSQSGSGDIFGGGGDIFGQNNNNLFSSPFANQQQMQNQASQKPDYMDKAFDHTIEASKSLWQVIKDLVGSIKLRDFDDLGYLQRQQIIVGLIIQGISLVLGLMGTLAGIPLIGFLGMPLRFLFTGLLVQSTGLITMGCSAIALSKIHTVTGNDDITSIPNIQNTPEGSQDVTNEYEDNLGGILDDMMDDDDFGQFFGDDEDTSDDDFSANDYPEPAPQTEEINFINPLEQSLNEPPQTVDYRTALDNIRPNQIINRKTLMDSILPMLPTTTPDFAETKEIEQTDEDFLVIQSILQKAAANVLNKDPADINIQIESIKENKFSYVIKVKRIKGLNKHEDFAIELETYFKEDERDNSVNVTINMTGDFFVITATKGENHIISWGDLFKDQKQRDYFYDEKHKLPVFLGIDDTGRVLMDDAKYFDSLMVVGKPRSGKSWYVLNLILSLMAFNTPQDVQFIIIDPKKQNLFKTISLMPHVLGCFDDSRVLEVMDGIIRDEGERRKKILSDNHCENIWDLRAKGTKIPILYLIIDEVMTVDGNLAQIGKDEQQNFRKKMAILISQLPYVGIRLIMIPHRSTGLIDKTIRGMLHFSAAVRAEQSVVCETLDIKKCRRSCTQVGQLAFKSINTPVELYAQGPAVTSSDIDNTDLIVSIASAFYKMGVEPAEHGALPSYCIDRDEDKVRERLEMQATIQYDVNKVKQDFEDIERETYNSQAGQYNPDDLGSFDSFNNLDDLNSLDLDLDLDNL